MSSEWELRPLAEIANEVTVGFVGSMATEYVASGIPFLRSLNIDAFDVNVKDLKFITPEFHRRIKKSALKPGDVAIVRTGKPGTCTVIPDWLEDANCSDLVLVRCGEKIRPHFLCYWVNSIAAHHIASHTVGAVQQHFNVGAAKTMMVAVPPLFEQDQVVAVLRSLDDRITLLRETNATLEAIAQALFKSWFVDFDPVRAKMEGRVPEVMDEATAALFPDGFEESALGLVPRGWTPLTVSDASEIVKGKSYSSKDLVAEHETALVTLKSFARGGGFRLDGFKPYAGTYKASQVVVSGDLIVAYTDVTQAAELIGKPAIVIGVNEHKTLVASLDVGIVRPSDLKVSRQFLFGLFNTAAFQAHTLSHASGTTVLHLSKNGVGSYKFICPPISLVVAFSDLAESLTNRQQVNIDQMRNLATIRDTLLPRLISGQLRLPEAQASVEEVLA